MATSTSTNGFTIIELLVALIIIMVGMMALLKSVEIAAEQNARTQMRTEAVQIAEERMRRMQTVPFQSMSTTYRSYTVQSRLRGMSKQYSVATSVAPQSLSSRLVGVTVTWNDRSVAKTHSTYLMKTNPEL